MADDTGLICLQKTDGSWWVTSKKDPYFKTRGPFASQRDAQNVIDGLNRQGSSFQNGCARAEKEIQNKLQNAGKK